MPKKSRNPSRKLTKKDKDILDKYYDIHIYNIKHLIKNYPDPKNYAIKVLSRKQPKKYDMDSFKTLIFTKFMYPSPAFRPRDLDKFLKTNQLNNKTENNQSNGLFLDGSNSSRYLDSDRLRDGILKKIERQGHIYKSNNKLDYKKYIKKEINKNESKFVNEDEGGPRSIYLISEEMARINQILNDPLSMAYLNDKIIRSGYAEKFTSYLMFVLFYLLRSEEKAFDQLMNLGATYYSEKLTDSKKFETEQRNNMLKKFTDDQLKVFCDKLAEISVKIEKTYIFINLFSLVDS